MANSPSKKTAGEFKAMPAKEHWDTNADPERNDFHDDRHLPLNTTLDTCATASIDDITGSIDHDLAGRRQNVPKKLLDYPDKLGRFHKISNIIRWVYKSIDMWHYQDTSPAMVASGKETSGSEKERTKTWEKDLDDVLEDSARYIAAQEELPPTGVQTSAASTITDCDDENDDEESVNLVKTQWMEYVANEMSDEGIQNTEEVDDEMSKGSARDSASQGGHNSNAAASEDHIGV